MLNPLRPLVLLILTITISVGAATADAAPVEVGDYIRVENGPGTTGGGEFTILVDDTEEFISFCLQQTQYIDFTHQFHVDSISTYAFYEPDSRGGEDGKDYLSEQTAFLYTQFRAGTLTGYNYAGPDRWKSADKLQKAIWMFEEEIAMVNSNPFVILANTEVGLGKWVGLGDVAVLNLSLNGRGAQDQLMLLPEREITAVPEPASLLLFGSGVSIAAAVRRRKQRRQEVKA